MFFPMMDPTLLILIPAVMLCAFAQAKVTSNFSRYSQVKGGKGITGAEAARRMLDKNGLYDVEIKPVQGTLTDHYDPRTKTVNLSDPVYSSGSIAAISVAAHECGHAIQHNRAYFPLTLRSTLVPVANIGSTMAWPLIIIGLLFSSSSSSMFIQLGIWAFALSVLFQIVTLPVELDASRRALVSLNDNRMVPSGEMPAAKNVLGAAALTYVASAAASILQLLRLILLFGGRRDD